MYAWFRQLMVKSNSVSSSSSSSSSSTVSTSNRPKPPPPRPALTSSVRWTCKYDVCVCHSTTDVEVAMCMVAYLEAPPRGLRCFLWHRDSCPGAAKTSELCQAVETSHCQVLLITADFLVDEWCRYMMQQALANSPTSSRIIPLMLNLSRSQYPVELRYLYYTDLSSNPERGYSLVFKTVLKYLDDVIKAKEMCSNVDNSSNGASSQQNKMSSNPENPEPRLSRRGSKKTETVDS